MASRFGAHARSHSAHLAGAFFVMGSWAFFANYGHGPGDALAAALLQGVLAALVTLSLKTFVEKIASRFSGRAALVLPPLAAFVIVGAVLILVPRVAATPEVAGTIALPLAAASAYAAVYNA